jgi:tetratricopeptide (TPR) repeat protein
VTPVYLLAGSSPFYGGPRERFRKAELLERAGRHEEALTWYGSFDNLSFYEAPFEAAAQKERGAILEKLGRKAEAAEAYRRFIAFWRDADPDLQPQVTQARERLAALQQH